MGFYPLCFQMTYSEGSRGELLEDLILLQEFSIEPAFPHSLDLMQLGPGLICSTDPMQLDPDPGVHQEKVGVFHLEVLLIQGN